MESEDWRVVRKPLQGACPFFVRSSQRIAELAEAIQRYAGSDETALMIEWAEEIAEQCRMINTLRQIAK